MPDRRLHLRSQPTLRCCILLLSATIPMIFSAPRASAAPTAVRLGDGIVRFDADAAARAAAEPYPGFSVQPPTTGPAPADFPVSVDFYRVNRRAAARVAVPRGTSTSTAPARCPGRCCRNGRTHRLLEHRRLRLRRRPRPQPLPVAPVGAGRAPRRHRVRRARRHDLAACVIDLTGGIRVRAPHGPAFPRDRDRARLAAGGGEGALADLHRPHAAAARAGRWATSSAATRTRPTREVREIAARASASAHIPCDVIWLDIDYMDGFRSFTFDPVRLPRPGGADRRRCTRDGFHSVCDHRPGHQAASPATASTIEGTRADAVGADAPTATTVHRHASGRATCVFPDFTDAPTRALVGRPVPPTSLAHGRRRHLERHERAGGVRRRASKTMPDDNVHRADADLGGTGTHARYHNVYGMQMARGDARRAARGAARRGARSCSRAPTTSAASATPPRGPATTRANWRAPGACRCRWC